MNNPERELDRELARKPVSEMTRLERETVKPVREFSPEEKDLDKPFEANTYDPTLPPEFQHQKPLVNDHLEFQAAAPYMGIEDVASISPREEKMIHLMVSGMSAVVAGRAVGMTKKSQIRKAMDKPAVKQAIEHYTELFREEVNFGVANAHLMYMESYRASATATEMKNATDSLCKLHGINKEKPGNSGTTIVQMNNNVSLTTRQLEKLSDKDLLEILDRDPDALKPQALTAREQFNQNKEKAIAQHQHKLNEQYPYDAIEHTPAVTQTDVAKASNIQHADVDDDHIERFDG